MARAIHLMSRSFAHMHVPHFAGRWVSTQTAGLAGVANESIQEDAWFGSSSLVAGDGARGLHQVGSGILDRSGRRRLGFGLILAFHRHNGVASKDVGGENLGERLCPYPTVSRAKSQS